jgi:hypothetical protein
MNILCNLREREREVEAIGIDIILKYSREKV